MSKKHNISDIAKLAGVGTTTVSRVLNQDPKVKPSTRDKVEAIIRSVGYVPSKSAIAMRTKSNKVVGIMVSRLDSPSENRAVRGLLEVLYANGYDAIIMESEFSAKKVDENIQVLLHKGVDGLILFAFTGLDLTQLQGWKNKVVLVAREYPGLSSVCFDDQGAVELIMSELVSRGLHRISYIGVDTSDSTTGLKRLQAYQGFCESHQIQPHFALGSLDHHSGYRCAEELLQAESDGTPQALVCASDTLALGAATWLQRQNRHEIQVTGLGDNEMLRFMFPESVSVNLGYKQAGKLAAEQLLGQLRGELEIQAITTPCQLRTNSQ